MPRQIKQLDDEELEKDNEQFIRLNVEDKDDVDFDFEEDIGRVIKQLNVRKLIKNDTKYMRNFRKALTSFYLQSYLLDNINVGEKKINRFLRLYTEKESS